VRALKAAYLAAHPLCELCRARGWLRPATQADHKLARRAGGADDWANLQALCQACHSHKTVTEDGGFGRNPADRK
jgi:5-methylcytosine-specific restriction protein A